MSAPAVPLAALTLSRRTPCAGAWRIGFVAVWMTVCGIGLAARLMALQAFSAEEFARQVDRQTTWRETMPARPGDVLDRHGRVLATTVTSRSLFLVPRRIGDPWDLSRRLAEALALDADRLFEKICTQPDKGFLWVKRRLTEEEAERVRGLGLPREAWGFRDEFLRQYPQEALAAQVIGLRDIDGEGRGGIEQQYDSTLRGRGGWREWFVDARGRLIDVLDQQSPVEGTDVVLAIDIVAQWHAERALEAVMEEFRPRGCSAVVMLPQSGEILAMASRPTFNPNRPDQADEAAWTNRALSDRYEPGSTLKPFIVGWGLDCGLIETGTAFDCEQGEYRMGRRLLHDHHPYGTLNLTDILVKSSNIGMAKIGERLTNARLHAALRAFGFGARTGIDLPGEASGTVHPLHAWTSYSTGSIPMGQELSATPLQIITAYAALANGGVLTTPRVAREFRGRAEFMPTSVDGSLSHPRVAVQVISPDAARWLVETPLRQVVVRGTGRKADLPGIAVFGKSGTAQKPDPATGRPSNSLHVSSFVCGAPADNPRVLVLVTVDEPTRGGPDHYGGTVAAPAAAEILRQVLPLVL